MLKLSGSNLTSQAVVRAVREGWTISLDTAQLAKVSQARELVLRLLDEGAPVYGINTGFGKLAETSISRESVAELQRNLILSHSCGVGEPFSGEVVKAMIILRANALMKRSEERRVGKECRCRWLGG